MRKRARSNKFSVSFIIRQIFHSVISNKFSVPKLWRYKLVTLEEEISNFFPWGDTYVEASQIRLQFVLSSETVCRPPASSMVAPKHKPNHDKSLRDVKDSKNLFSKYFFTIIPYRFARTCVLEIGGLLSSKRPRKISNTQRRCFNSQSILEMRTSSAGD